MAIGAKEIRRRIKSIQNTKKITRAMEMVAASKMRKALSRVLASRPYAEAAWEILTHLSESSLSAAHPLLKVRPVKRICLIFITSNRGLCGGFNSQIARKVFTEVRNPNLLKINRSGAKRIDSSVANEEIEIDFITIGKKGALAVQRLGKKIIATFDDLSYLADVYSIRPLAKLVMDDYSNKIYDKVVIAYTDYISPLVQRPKLRQLLPLSRFDLEKQIAELRQMAEEAGEKEFESARSEYLFEPDTSQVLGELIPRLIEMQIYRGLLESNASKEAARMLAMRNATEAASDIIADLTLVYNKSRQASITREIIEVSAGATFSK